MKNIRMPKSLDTLRSMAEKKNAKLSADDLLQYMDAFIESYKEAKSRDLNSMSYDLGIINEQLKLHESNTTLLARKNDFAKTIIPRIQNHLQDIARLANRHDFIKPFYELFISSPKEFEELSPQARSTLARRVFGRYNPPDKELHTERMYNLLKRSSLTSDTEQEWVVFFTKKYYEMLAKKSDSAEMKAEMKAVQDDYHQQVFPKKNSQLLDQYLGNMFQVINTSNWSVDTPVAQCSAYLTMLELTKNDSALRNKYTTQYHNPLTDKLILGQYPPAFRKASLGTAFMALEEVAQQKDSKEQNENTKAAYQKLKKVLPLCEPGRLDSQDLHHLLRLIEYMPKAELTKEKGELNFLQLVDKFIKPMDLKLSAEDELRASKLLCEAINYIPTKDFDKIFPHLDSALAHAQAVKAKAMADIDLDDNEKAQLMKAAENQIISIQKMKEDRLYYPSAQPSMTAIRDNKTGRTIQTTTMESHRISEFNDVRKKADKGDVITPDAVFRGLQGVRLKYDFPEEDEKKLVQGQADNFFRSAMSDIIPQEKWATIMPSLKELGELLIQRNATVGEARTIARAIAPLAKDIRQHDNIRLAIQEYKEEKSNLAELQHKMMELDAARVATQQPEEKSLKALGKEFLMAQYLQEKNIPTVATKYWGYLETQVQANLRSQLAEDGLSTENKKQIKDKAYADARFQLMEMNNLIKDIEHLKEQFTDPATREKMSLERLISIMGTEITAQKKGIDNAAVYQKIRIEMEKIANDSVINPKLSDAMRSIISKRDKAKTFQMPEATLSPEMGAVKASFEAEGKKIMQHYGASGQYMTAQATYWNNVVKASIDKLQEHADEPTALRTHSEQTLTNKTNQFDILCELSRQMVIIQRDLNVPVKKSFLSFMQKGKKDKEFLRDLVKTLEGEMLKTPPKPAGEIFDVINQKLTSAQNNSSLSTQFKNNLANLSDSFASKIDPTRLASVTGEIEEPAVRRRPG